VNSLAALNQAQVEKHRITDPARSTKNPYIMKSDPSDSKDVPTAAAATDDVPSWYAKMNVNETSLEDQASWASIPFLSYVTPLVRLGGTKILDSNDVGVPNTCDRADVCYAAIKRTWTSQIEKNDAINGKAKAKYDAKLEKMTIEKRQTAKPFTMRKPGLITAILTAFGLKRLLLGFLFMIGSALLNFIPVLILEDLVLFFENGGSTDTHDSIVHPWVEVAALFVVPVISSMLQTHASNIFLHGSIFVKSAVSALLYEKSLDVSAAGRAVTSTGQVVNMMSNDTAQLQRFAQFAFGLVLTAPLQIVISLYLIHQQVGSATWVGVAYMVALAPINVVIFSILGKMRIKVLKYSDLRVKMMNEILTGIRIIKYYAWEKAFKKEVDQIRENELRKLTQLAHVSGIGFSVILLSVPIIQPILVFLVYIKTTDEPLTAAKAFTTVALFNIMRFPFAFIPMGILQYIQSNISIGRLTQYLTLPKLEKYVLSTVHPDHVDQPDAPESQVGSVTMKNTSFCWTNYAANIIPIDGAGDNKAERLSRSRHGGGSVSSGSVLGAADTLQDIDTLSDITATIAAGEIVAVVGAVGCGKSSFLSAILGEMEPKNNSNVYIPRNSDASMKSSFMSYCSQSPWVVNDTLRGNILFGRVFDEERYKLIVDACALTSDLVILPAGDMTEIGERGINLSGGQKARVSLARALYARDTKIMLFDDPLSAVDSHVGEHLLNNALMGDITKGVTRILVTHQVHVLSRCDKVIMLEDGQIKHFGNFDDLEAQGVDFAGAVEFEGEEDPSEGMEGTDASKVTDRDSDEVDEKETAALIKKGENLTTKEEREEGAVEGKLYMKYARAGGVFTFINFFLVQGLGRGAEVAAAFWLAFWSKEAVEAQMAKQNLTDSETMYYLRIYAALGMGGVLCLAFRAILMAYHRLRSSRLLHENLTSSILRAPVAFFDVTPTGRILNRFAADTDKIDLDLTQSIGQGSSTVFSVLGALGAIAVATKGTFFVPLVPISYLYYIIQKWFRKTSTELQRLTSIAGSPIFADFSQVLSGTSTIRAYGENERFFEQSQVSFSNFNATYYLIQVANSWLGLRLDMIGGCIAAFIGGIAVATAKYNFIPAGWLGLALSYSIEVTGFLKHGVRMIAVLEADMSSVERVIHYSENIESEKPAVIKDQDPPSSWPRSGRIDFERASMRYRDGPLVLKEISVRINGGEKIGVVGRTGSGKSSLMNLLFRITEADENGGSVSIDGVDISKIGTDVLRTKLSIIPQDPVMFSNTVRYNLDPFGEATETELRDVLHKVELSNFIESLPDGLDEKVAEGGENFSQGQRQLLCIARSLLRKPKILVLDEATASIDNTTDNLIQEMIRTNFADATVLTIAHRLNTVLDSDRILVLNDGEVVEFDTPKKLLAQPNSAFKKMVDANRMSMSIKR